MRARWLAPLLCAALCLASAAAHALPIEITSALRSAAAEGSGAAGSASQSASTSALGPASLEALAPQEGPAWATGRSALESELGASLLSATGETLARATAPPGALHAARAEALYRVEFVATADALLRLSGSLAWDSDGPSQALAFVELSSIDTTLDPLLLHFALDGPEDAAPFDVLAALHEGVAYRLVGFARAEADALGDETGSGVGGFAFRVVAVPEPGTLAVVGAGLAALARRARR